MEDRQCTGIEDDRGSLTPCAQSAVYVFANAVILASRTLDKQAKHDYFKALHRLTGPDGIVITDLAEQSDAAHVESLLVQLWGRLDKIARIHGLDAYEFL